MRRLLFGFAKNSPPTYCCRPADLEACESGLTYANNYKRMTLDRNRPAENIASWSVLFIAEAVADSLGTYGDSRSA